MGSNPSLGVSVVFCYHVPVLLNFGFFGLNSRLMTKRSNPSNDVSKSETSPKPVTENMVWCNKKHRKI